MRAVRAAAVVLAAVAVLVLCSALHVRSAVSEMAALTQALPEAPSPETAAGAEAVLRMLDEAEPVLCLVVPRPVSERVRALAVSLRERALAGDAAGTSEARALLGESVNALGRMERVDWRNIFGS